MWFSCTPLKIPRPTCRPHFKFSPSSLGAAMSLQRPESHVPSLIAQRRMTLRLGRREEEITFIKKFRFLPILLILCQKKIYADEMHK